jgi:pimeloyl-ACP methyl ester carboxylesterase
MRYRLRISALAAATVACACAAQETISFRTDDGATISGDLYGVGTRGVVLAHGGRFKKESWREQARALADAGYRVLAFDFRGVGKSRGPGDSDIMSAPLYHDALAAVRYLHEHGATSVSIVGGSLGGGAAGDASIHSRPGEIDAVVFLGASPNEPADGLKSRSLFICARDDSSGDGTKRLPRIQSQYEKAPKPKELIVLDGSAHAQFLFQSEQGPQVMREILRFLQSK